MQYFYKIVNVETGETIEDHGVNTSTFRNICRSYLTDPVHLGERLQVKRTNSLNECETIFDVTSIRYRSGNIRMTLYEKKPSVQNENAHKDKEQKDEQEKISSETGIQKSLAPNQLDPMPEFSGPEGMREMYELAKRIFNKVRNDENLWKYVIGYPILWFGDFEAYRKSKVKIITVGINPSQTEFQSEGKDKFHSFFRFPGWEEKGMTSKDYFNGMKQYFEHKPYSGWFGKLASDISLENMWNASFFAGDTPSTVLHIDFCTPCATTPTWTGEDKTTKEKLPLSVKKKLTEIQDKYFETLYHFLKPEIVFIGSAQFDEFQQHEKFTPLADMDGGNPLYQNLSNLISNLKNLDGNPHGNRRQLKFWSASDGTIFVSGQYRGNPFGAYSQDGLQEIMREFIRAAKTDPTSIISKKY